MCALFPLTVTVICTRSPAPTPCTVTVAFEFGALKFKTTVPLGTLLSVNWPWLSAFVEMPVPTTEIVTPLFESSVVNVS